jgi:small subunit ribosomal protein S20
LSDEEGLTLANTKSAIKRIRSDERKRIRNRFVRTSTRTYIKKVRALEAGGDPAQVAPAVKDAIKALDMAAEKGIIHKNNAARRKSRLMKMLNKLSAKA